MKNNKFNFLDLDITSKIVAIGLIAYYLIPFTIPFLHFSPHLLFFGVAFLILALKRKKYFTKQYNKNRILFLLFAGLFLFSVYCSPFNAQKIEYLRAWLFSIMTFFVVRSTFHVFSFNVIRAMTLAIIIVWSLTCFVQISSGGEYLYESFDVNRNIIYATGLSKFSNHGAVIMVPMLTLILTSNLNKINWWCSVIWAVGCAALYFTLSRAGWLALIVAMIVVSVRYRCDVSKQRNMLHHAALGLLAMVLAWTIPTKIDQYEFNGDKHGGRWSTLNVVVSEEPLFVLNSSGDYSAATRIITLNVAAKAIYEHPLTGIGLGAFPEYYSQQAKNFSEGIKVDARDRMTPHNGYAQFVAEVGVPSFIVLAIWVGFMILRLSRSVEPTAVAIHASIVGVLSWMIFHDGLYERYLWILLGSGAAIASRSLSISKKTT